MYWVVDRVERSHAQQRIDIDCRYSVMPSRRVPWCPRCDEIRVSQAIWPKWRGLTKHACEVGPLNLIIASTPPVSPLRPHVRPVQTPTNPDGQVGVRIGRPVAWVPSNARRVPTHRPTHHDSCT